LPELHQVYLPATPFRKSGMTQGGVNLAYQFAPCFEFRFLRFCCQLASYPEFSD
jgi:hypothetical protein